jgi:hypothetical protein
MNLAGYALFIQNRTKNAQNNTLINYARKNWHTEKYLSILAL